jgi:hypothetical protein
MTTFYSIQFINIKRMYRKRSQKNYKKRREKRKERGEEKKNIRPDMFHENPLLS